MKRLSIIMVLALAVVMCACAGDKKENNKNESMKGIKTQIRPKTERYSIKNITWIGPIINSSFNRSHI